MVAAQIERAINDALALEFAWPAIRAAGSGSHCDERKQHPVIARRPDAAIQWVSHAPLRSEAAQCAYFMTGLPRFARNDKARLTDAIRLAFLREPPSWLPQLTQNSRANILAPQPPHCPA